jgi:molecular chaperone DnaJ
VELRPGVQSSEIITVKDRGVTKLLGNGRGDLRIGVQVVTPTKLDHKERELIQQFATRYKAPAPALGHFQQGLFAKLRDRFLG